MPVLMHYLNKHQRFYASSSIGTQNFFEDLKLNDHLKIIIEKIKMNDRCLRYYSLHLSFISIDCLGLHQMDLP